MYVKDAFEEVSKAEQERNSKLQGARGYYDETVRKAEGEAAAIRAGGIVASNSLVLAVSSEAKFFRDQLPYYRQDPAGRVSRAK